MCSQIQVNLTENKNAVCAKCSISQNFENASMCHILRFYFVGQFYSCAIYGRQQKALAVVLSTVDSKGTCSCAIYGRQQKALAVVLSTVDKQMLLQ